MDAIQSEDGTLTDSWVEVQCNVEGEDAMIDSTASVISSGSIQTLSTTPPLSQFSGSAGEQFGRPKIEVPQQQLGDFIWDWSSRPEVIPPSGFVTRMRHPPKRRISDSNVHEEEPPAKCFFCWGNLPRLIFTNACSFILGATIMFLALRKYCHPQFARRFVQM